jgi:UDP-glucuronate 4-epimerase
VARILITGGAGFIGSHLAEKILRSGDSVVALDNFDPFYDVAIKRRNVEALQQEFGDRYVLVEGDIRSANDCQQALDGVGAVVHLAALAGVRPSLQDPARYMDVNVTGTQVLLNAVQEEHKRGAGIKFVFGSSSSVYGGNEKVPFAESDPVNGPVSPYAASKRAGELLCHSFHHLSGVSVTCLRFFTVFGPGQRPDLAIHKFSRMILDGEPLPFYGDGSTSRDYTFVTDIVDGVMRAVERADGYRIYNLGGHDRTTLSELVAGIEVAFGAKATLDRQPEQPGDVPRTYADTALAEQELGYQRKVGIAEGLRLFAEWFLAERASGRV